MRQDLTYFTKRTSSTRNTMQSRKEVATLLLLGMLAGAALMYGVCTMWMPRTRVVTVCRCPCDTCVCERPR